MGDYLRLRQICLVASDLEAAAKQISGVFDTEVCFRDPGVGKYGLHNVLFPFSGTFLEVVSPMQPGTTAERYIERRKGDGGYMYIVDCDDLEARREHARAMGIRIVADVKSEHPYATSEAVHLHPRDTGGCLLSIDRHSEGRDLTGGYGWAGPDWRRFDRSSRVHSIVGAEIQCDDPAETAARWRAILDRTVNASAPDVWTMRLDLGFLQFAPLGDDRGEGLSEVHLKVRDRDAITRAAATAGLAHGADWVEMVGVRFNLLDAA